MTYKKLKKAIFILGIIASIFCAYIYGIISFRNNLFPIPTLRKFIHSGDIYKKTKVDNIDFYNKNISKEVKNIKNIYDNIEVLKTRNSIIENYIIPEKLVDINYSDQKSYDCYSGASMIETKFYGVQQRGFFEDHNAKNLVIYFQGHSGDPCIKDYYKAIKSNTRNNFDFLSFSMFGLGSNMLDSISFPIMLPQHKTSYIFESNNLKNLGPSWSLHDLPQYFYDVNNPHLKPLALFLSSPYYIIKKILEKKKYDNVIIMGISGGGWYSVIMSAIIPQIDYTFSFNGTLPLFYRLETDSKGDFEMQFSSIWKLYDYYMFYFLGLFDENAKLSRFGNHIFSEYDECCFSSPEVDFFEQSIILSGIPNIKTKIFRNKYEHDIDQLWIIDELQNIVSQ